MSKPILVKCRFRYLNKPKKDSFVNINQDQNEYHININTYQDIITKMKEMCIKFGNNKYYLGITHKSNIQNSKLYVKINGGYYDVPKSMHNDKVEQKHITFAISCIWNWNITSEISDVPMLLRKNAGPNPLTGEF
jgi:hypothetical protein